ncbi:MAG: hypothetical protein NUV91_04885 [Candidatus Omnitrophica bacterium]|nr:hypothetical protein [Candidatus Omnitrophota bacterium]
MNTKKGQSSAELAIFGVVLIFVIGLILRSGLTASQQMDVRLRAMRIALMESYKTSQAAYGETAAMSRNNAMVMLVEDRLSADASRTGTRDRIPNIAFGKGSLTNRFYEKSDFDEKGNLPIFDVIINGQRFPFTQAGYKSYQLVNERDGICQGITFRHTNRRVKRNDEEYICLPDCQDADAPLLGNDDRQWYPGGTCWSETCSIRWIQDPTPPNGQPPPPRPVRSGCPVFYRRLVNSSVAEEGGDAVGQKNKWCTGGDCNRDNLPADQRFDLDFDGENDLSGMPIEVKNNFAWQWVRVAGMAKRISALEDTANELGQGVYPVDLDTGENTVVDVDGDSKEEVILDYAFDGNGVLTTVYVIDRQEGDVDFTKDDADHQREQQKAEIEGKRYYKIEVGVQDAVNMYSLTKQGTYFQVQEGKLFNDDGQFVRNTTRQDQLDLIERFFHISNDTDRFCKDSRGASRPRDWLRDPPPGVASSSGIVSSLVNPVQACNDCTRSAAKRDVTCLEEEGKVLMIRSKIKDTRGRRWLTRPDAL